MAVGGGGLVVGGVDCLPSIRVSEAPENTVILGELRGLCRTAVGRPVPALAAALALLGKTRPGRVADDADDDNAEQEQEVAALSGEVRAAAGSVGDASGQEEARGVGGASLGQEALAAVAAAEVAGAGAHLLLAGDAAGSSQCNTLARQRSQYRRHAGARERGGGPQRCTHRLLRGAAAAATHLARSSGGCRRTPPARCSAGGVAQLVPRHQGGVRARHVEPLLGEVPGAVSEVVRRVINARGWGSVGWLTSQRGGRGGAQPMACLGRAGGTQPNRRQQR